MTWEAPFQDYGKNFEAAPPWSDILFYDSKYPLKIIFQVPNLPFPLLN